MIPEPVFQTYGWPHLTVIVLTITLPFVLAAVVHRTKSTRVERTIVALLSAVLVVNYIAYLIFVRSHGGLSWRISGELVARSKPCLLQICVLGFRIGDSSAFLLRTVASSSAWFS